ncbi:MAG: zinc metallopeptidase [Prevotellaceae bacterium]|jgi:Zn-dependent membrane protease YugP|nr:zinc metallopeptidase [Prevotellaceae bacterium]
MAMSYVIFGVFALLSYLVSARLKYKFGKYAKVPVNGRMTGCEVAEKMLRDNGITDVSVRMTDGFLSDHYNPANKTVNLSRNVYEGSNISAAAVAAHECGHALQHATAYSMLQLRSKLVPAVNFASMWMQWVLLAGIVFINVFPSLMLAGILLFAVTTLFSVVTLPVEINASARAVKWLDYAGIVTYDIKPYAVDALKWAAYTYVIAALGSLAQLVYFILLFLGNRR